MKLRDLTRHADDRTRGSGVKPRVLDRVVPHRSGECSDPDPVAGGKSKDGGLRRE